MYTSLFNNTYGAVTQTRVTKKYVKKHWKMLSLMHVHSNIVENTYLNIRVVEFIVEMLHDWLGMKYKMYIVRVTLFKNGRYRHNFEPKHVQKKVCQQNLYWPETNKKMWLEFFINQVKNESWVEKLITRHEKPILLVHHPVPCLWTKHTTWMADVQCCTSYISTNMYATLFTNLRKLNNKRIKYFSNTNMNFVNSLVYSFIP